MGDRLTRWLCLVGALGILTLMLAPILRADWAMIDDHLMFGAMPADDRASVGDAASFAVEMTAEPSGRFRPLYWVGQALELTTAGQHVAWWYVDRIMLAAVVVVLGFFVASKFIRPLPAALLALLPFAGPQVETWIRLGPNEAYAVPLALAGVAVVTLRAADGRPAPLEVAPGYVLLVLAALAKENFITLIPAAALVSVAMSWGRLRRADWLVLAVLAVVTLADLAVMAWKVGEYGTLYPQDRSLGAVLREGRMMIETQIREAWIWVPMVAVGVALLARRFTWQVAAAVGLALLLVVPQAVFLAGTVAEGRYLYPVAFLACLVWGLGFWVAARGPWPGAVTAVLVVAVAAPVGMAVEQTRDQAALTAATTERYQRQLSAVAHRAAAIGVDKVVIHPYQPSDIERVASMATYLTKVHDVTVSTVPVGGVDSAAAAAQSATLRSWSEDGMPTHYLRPRRPGRCLSVVLWPAGELGPSQPVCSSVIRLPAL